MEKHTWAIRIMEKQVEDLNIIACMAKNRTIGKDNKLPWHYASDMHRFRFITAKHAVVMGRKTYESIGRPLPNRHNIIVTSDTSYKVPGCMIAQSFDEGLALARKYDDSPFIIGGSQIYLLSIPLATKMYLTIIDKDYDGDTFFPEFDESEWNEVTSFSPEENIVFKTLERKND